MSMPVSKFKGLFMLINSHIASSLKVGRLSAGLVAICLCANPTITQAKPTTPIKLPTPQSCSIERANYTAIGNPELSLEFVPLLQPAIASEIVSFRLKHKTRGTIVTYNMGASNGYASLYLRDTTTSIEDDRGSDLKPVFFDANWQHSGLPLKIAPQYFFVSGLGSNDWYTERSGNRNRPVGEVIWQFSGCVTGATPQAKRPESDPVAAIVKQEMALLKQPPNRETKAAFQRLIRELVVGASEVHPTGVLIPSSATTAYFGDLYRVYPQSGVLAIMFARSLEAQLDDFGQVAPIYQDAIKASPNHPLLAKHYADYRQRQGIKQGLAVLEQAIRDQPQNLNAYLDLAIFQQDNPGLTIAVFDRAIAAFPKNAAVYTEFAKIALDRKYDRDSLTEISDRLVVAQKILPRHPDLSATIAALSKQVRKN